jgi:hypothetical protein
MRSPSSTRHDLYRSQRVYCRADEPNLRVLHREKFVVVDGVGLPLPRLERNHPLPPFGINLKQDTADGKVRDVAHDTERMIFVRQCQYRCAL